MRRISGLRDIRRVITAERSDKSSFVLSDGAPTRFVAHMAMLWATDPEESRVPVCESQDDPTAKLANLMGGFGSTRFSATWIEPRGTVEPGNAPEHNRAAAPDGADSQVGGEDILAMIANEDHG